MRAGPAHAELAGLPLELRHVEVDREDEGERDQGGCGHERLPGDVPERGEDRDVDEEVGFRVEVPPDQRHAAGCACELTVGVVEERLQLQEKGCDERLAARDREGRREPARGIRSDDRRGRDTEPRETGHKSARQRPEHELENELPARPPSVRGWDVGAVLARAGHRSMVILEP